MESAELKKEKRVRHCYPRNEVYHRWVHEETLVYHSRHIPVWGKYDWLFAGGYPAKTATREDIAKDWGYYESRCIAVIDRNKKRALITHKWRNHSYSVKSAIPDDYEIFLTDDEIPTPYILRDDEAVCKLHIKYLIEQFTNWYITPLYNILAGRTKVIYKNPLDIFTDSNRSYKDIKDFVKKYKLRKYDWSKISLNENYSIRINNRMWWKTEKIAIPSINKFVKGTVFNKKELILLEQKYFYSKYCYGNGIPFSDVVKYWNKQIPLDEAVLYLRRHNNYCKFNNVVVSQLWTDYIKIAIEAKRKYYRKQHQENINKSNENYRKAKEERDKLVNEVYTVADWREGKELPSTVGRGVHYRKYKYNSVTKSYIWTDDVIPFNFHHLFPNVQLRLTKDGRRIETSKGAVVPYDSAKELWRKFIIWINSNNVAENPIFKFDNKNIKVGIYNLRFINYCMKRTDDGQTCYNDNKSILDWLIQIGCHSIWLTDAIDFIYYYKLEKDFPLQYVLNPRVKPNINKPI